MSSDMYLVVDLNAICRFCLDPRGALSNIFEDDGKLSFLQQITHVTNIQVADSDELPKKVCHRCRFKIEMCYEFKSMVLESQSTLQENSTVELENITDESDYSKNEMLRDKVLDITNQPQVQDENTNVVRNVTPIAVQEESEIIHKKNPITAQQEVEKPQPLLKPYVSMNICQYPTTIAALKNNQCLLCFIKFEDKSLLHEHVTKHLEGTNLVSYLCVNDRNITCAACNDFFEYRYSYIRHIREHIEIKPFVCQSDGCGMSFYSNSSLKQHLPLHADKNFICSTCGMGFKRKSDLKLHEIIHLDENVLYHCSLCGILCKNRVSHAAHMRKHKMSPKFKCSKCAKQYYSRSELERHMLSHSKDKMFRCTLCNRKYYSKSALNRHFRDCNKEHKCLNATKSEYDLKCSLCGSCYGSNQDLADHLSSVHDSETLYRCMFCRKGFTTLVAVNRHKKTCNERTDNVENLADGTEGNNSVLDFEYDSPQATRVFVIVDDKASDESTQVN